MKIKLNILMILALVAATLAPLMVGSPAIAAGVYATPGSVDVNPASPVLTAVDPLAWNMFGDVLPARPFLYSVDAEGITITRFNDNQVVGTWPWPESVWIELPDGSIMEIFEPEGGWGNPVGMAVSYPMEDEIANRVKEIPDLTPPWTFVYVVMPHSGYEWQSASGFRDTLAPMTDDATESSLLLQIDVSDPSFSTSRDSAAPSEPHIAGAILGHGASQPVYDRKTGNVYVGNLPSNSLDAELASFVSVIHRIPPTVTAEEPEIPGIGKPVLRCGPQHPEVGIPMGMPQAYACYDPSGSHPINDNEHVGAFGELEDRDGDGTLDEQYEWEFRNLAGEETTGPIGNWLTMHINLVTGEPDGILYGTPPETGEWYAEARVHNLDDEYGVWSDWHPIRFLVTPTAEYLPIKAQFAAGVPVAYQLEGEGSCALTDAPAWIDVQPVLNGCVVMGRAPISGEYYNFSMPGFKETSYPYTEIVFSGNVVGAYGFVPIPFDPLLEEGAGISGLAWHQVEKYADPSTETPVLTGEFIGINPDNGVLYRILQAPGQPQPPNERPAETALTLDTVSVEADLDGTGFGQVAVEADRDIYVAAADINEYGVDGVVKVSEGSVSLIDLGFQPSSLSLDSDLRTAIPDVEPGQDDHDALWAAGLGKVALIDTSSPDMPVQIIDDDLPGASCVSVDYVSQFAYVANGTTDVTIFAPVIDGTTISRPPMAPRIWSSEEINWNIGYPGEFQLMASGDTLPLLALFDVLDVPAGLIYADTLDGTATIGGTPGLLTGGDGYAYALTATNSQGVYAQALGMTVYGPATFTTGDTARFAAGSASSFTVAATAVTAPILYTWAEEPVMAPGIQLVDHEDGTAGLQGIPTMPGTYYITIGANTGFLTDELDTTQLFTLIVEPEGTSIAPTITSGDTVTWDVIGAPYSPDQVTITSIGSPTPSLSVEGTLPPGVNFIDNGDSTGALGADCQISWPGMAPECLGVLPPEAEGTWTFNIKATNDGGVTYAIQEFNMIIETATSIMTPPPTAPANLLFDYWPGDPIPPAQTFSVRTLGDTMPYAAVTTASWLSATPESGIVGLDVGDLTVSVDPTGLAPGTYTGTVLVTSAGTEGPFATAIVTLTVHDPLSPGMLGVYPSALRFAYKVNDGTLPPVQSVLVLSGGVPLDYTVSTGEAKWLKASAGGTAPGVIRVSVNPRVGVGMHIANLEITSGEQIQTIPVTLVKTAGYANLIEVMFDAGGAPEGLAANLSTHNLFTTSSNAAAEAAEAGGGGGNEPPAPPEPSIVFHLNPLDKTLVGEIVVHSAGEYIGVNSKTGMAYQASQETGELTVIDGSTNTVSAYIALIHNGDVYMPYQIAVDEVQNIIYVGAKSPEPEPGALDGPPYGCMAIRELPSDEGGEPELDCWHAGHVFVIDGETNTIVGGFDAGDDPEGVVFAAATKKVYASNEDDGNVTVAKGAIRNKDGSFTNAVVLYTIINGNPVSGPWTPTCDANNYCGAKEDLQIWLWPDRENPSACYGIDDEAEEADKMAVDPLGNVYIIDDRYRVAKINGSTYKVTTVLGIPGYDCEETVPDDTPVLFRNTANNIAYMALGQGKLYVVSEQNTVSLIDPAKMIIKATITVPEAGELDAITTDKTNNHVYITDEELAVLWILKAACANGTGQCAK